MSKPLVSVWFGTGFRKGESGEQAVSKSAMPSSRMEKAKVWPLLIQPKCLQPVSPFNGWAPNRALIFLSAMALPLNVMRNMCKYVYLNNNKAMVKSQLQFRARFQGLFHTSGLYAAELEDRL
jgi:hypothetical protein